MSANLAPRPGQNFCSPPAATDPLQRFGTLPLRFFLGLTFTYAGLQKIVDRGYLDPTSGTYLGGQLQAFAASSPIGFLIQAIAVPNVQVIGQAVIAMELGVGILVIAGLLTRLAAAVGALLSLVLFVSATWDVQPYFLGSDTIYAVAWATMALVGDRGIFSLQAFLRDRFRGRARRRSDVPAVTSFGLDRRTLLLRAGGGLVGLVWLLAILPKGQQALVSAADPPDASPPPSNPFRAISSMDSGTAAQAPSSSVEALPTPAATSTPLPSVAPLSSLKPLPLNPATSAPPVPTKPVAPTPVSSAAPKIVAPQAAARPAGNVIATLAQLQQSGGALPFRDPRNGGPSLLIDLGGGSVVAYSAICTHAGCTVEYAARRRLLFCPCHGATFDPAQGSRVVRGPARRPLPPVSVSVGADGSVSLA